MAGAFQRTMVYLGLAEEEEARYLADDEVEVPDMVKNRDEVEHRAEVTPLRDRQLARVVAPTPSGELSRITTIHPRSYNDAKSIGEQFREGVPVIMNLTDMNDADAKRLVDFSAGLVFGLNGALERVTSKVFLLSPAHVEITADGESPAGSASGAFFNQS